MGNTWKTLAWWLTIERQVKSWLQMRSETRVWRKKGACRGQKTRWEEGKETSEHLCSLRSPTPQLPYLVTPHSSFISSSPTFPHHLQTTGLPDKMQSHSFSSQLPWQPWFKDWHLASEMIVTATTRMQDSTPYTFLEIYHPPNYPPEKQLLGVKKQGKHGPSQAPAPNYRPRNHHRKLNRSPAP